MRVFITGGAGVGKSVLIKNLVEWLRAYTAVQSGTDPVCLCAPTGVAAYNIQGQTTHSAFRLPVDHHSYSIHKELTCTSLKQLMNQFLSVHTIIIDEISMVSSATLLHIHRRLTALFKNSETFGGRNVILVGGFFQPRPVFGQSAFINSFMKQNIRQCADPPYACLLNRIRIGSYDEKDIHCLKSRLILDTNLPDNSVMRLSPTRQEVNNHNLLALGALSYLSTVFYAEHRYSENDIKPEEDCTDYYIPDDDTDADGLPLQLRLSVGTPVMLIIGTHVMLISNINIQYGLSMEL